MAAPLVDQAKQREDPGIRGQAVAAAVPAGPLQLVPQAPKAICAVVNRVVTRQESLAGLGKEHHDHAHDHADARAVDVLRGDGALTPGLSPATGRGERIEHGRMGPDQQFGRLADSLAEDL